MNRFLPICVLLALLSPACGEEAYRGDIFTYRMKHLGWTYHFDSRMDILFVIDNSPSMAAKQEKLVGSLRSFVESIGHFLPLEQIHMAVVTTSMESSGCPTCTLMNHEDCLQPTDLNHELRDYLGHITWSADGPVFDFAQDESCQVATEDNLDCFFDPQSESGTALVGIQGCPYRHGLAAMRHALLIERDKGENSLFLREDAALTVAYISDGEDCGDIGDISETIPGIDGRICSYAAKRIGPGGETSHPDDPNGRRYELTPPEEYYDFLMGLKNDREGMVKFLAITGITDVADPSTTVIEYESTDPSSPIVPACSIPNCTWGNCTAAPGTRAIELANMFSYNGFVDTICQDDMFGMAKTMGQFVSCPGIFRLDYPVRDPDLVAFFFNDQPLPRYSCSVRDDVVPCEGPGGYCEQGNCVETWHYHPPAPDNPWPMIEIADHIDPCMLEQEHPIHIDVDLWYVAE